MPVGYYQNEFGSDNTNLLHKNCPKGFICADIALPKYYMICPV